MQFTRRAKLLTTVGLLLVASITLIVVPGRHQVTVSFVRYEEDGRFVVLEFSNHGKSGTTCFWDPHWRTPDMSGTFVALDEKETRLLRLAKASSLNSPPFNLEVTYYPEPSK